MVWKRSYRRRYKKRYTRNTRQKRVKQLVDGKSTTMAERIAGYIGPIGQLAKTVVGMQKMINSEAKFNDDQASSVNTVTVPKIYCLTEIGQGDTDTDRNGNTILLKDIQIRFSFKNMSTTQPHRARMILFVDKDCSGVYPTAQELLQIWQNYLSPINKDYSKRFVLVKDKVFYLSNASAGDSVITDKWYCKVPFHTHYSSGGESPEQRAKENQLFLLIMSDTDTTNAILTDYYARLNYYDN